MLMVGAKVLFNSAKMLKMGVLAVFMHVLRAPRGPIILSIATLVQSHLGVILGWCQGMFFQPALRPY